MQHKNSGVSLSSPKVIDSIIQEVVTEGLLDPSEMGKLTKVLSRSIVRSRITTSKPLSAKVQDYRNYIREFLQKTSSLSCSSTVNKACKSKHRKLAGYHRIKCRTGFGHILGIAMPVTPHGYRRHMVGTVKKRLVRLRCQARCFKYRLPHAMRLAMTVHLPARYNGYRSDIAWKLAGRIIVGEPEHSRDSESETLRWFS